MAWCPQDTVLFNDTLLYNIGYGRPSASRQEIEEAARMAQISDFVKSLPNGFDTEVGERGLKLSGGGKAARGHRPNHSERPLRFSCSMRQPPLLDSHTEQEIQAALDEVSQNRTTLGHCSPAFHGDWC